MVRLSAIHPDNPQERLVRQIADGLAGGALAVCPSDAGYLLVCGLHQKQASERLAALRGCEAGQLSLLCADLAVLGRYAKLDNSRFRTIKAAVPGPYVFVLPAGREVPNRVVQPKRKTVGFRIPQNRIAQALLAAAGEPLLCATLFFDGGEELPTDPYDIRDRLAHAVDFVIDGGWCGSEAATVVDMSEEGETRLLRRGAGDAALFGG